MQCDNAERAGGKNALYYIHFRCFRLSQDDAEKVNGKPLLTGWSLVRIRPGEPIAIDFITFFAIVGNLPRFLSLDAREELRRLGRYRPNWNRPPHCLQPYRFASSDLSSRASSVDGLFPKM